MTFTHNFFDFPSPDDDRHFQECEDQDPSLPCICPAILAEKEELDTEAKIDQVLEESAFGEVTI